MPGRPGRLDAAVDQGLRSHDGPHERPREINLKEILVNSPAKRPEALPGEFHPGVKAEPLTVAQMLCAEAVV
jgi:hypothetical protein